MRRMRGDSGGEEGYVIVTVAILLAVLCGCAALAVDINAFLGARAAAQRAVDAGALAGAFTFVNNPLAQQPATAQSQAVATTTANGMLGEPILPAEVTVDVDVAGRLVTVDVTHPVSTFFARALGINSVNIGATALAEAWPNATGVACAKPWFMGNTMLSGLDPCAACAAGEVFIAAGGISSFASSRLGAQFTLKPGNPQNALAPGQFYAIAMGESTGGAAYRDNISTCSQYQLFCQQSYMVEPGNMIGPTAQGVRELIGPDPDTYVDIGQYQRGDGTIGDTSPQLISMPVWDPCAMAGFCPDGGLPENGRNLQIPIIGFATVFIEGLSGNDVMGRLVNVAACGSGGGSPGPAPGEIGPYGMPVRLVRTQ